jgi:hypothetical protein
MSKCGGRSDSEGAPSRKSVPTSTSETRPVLSDFRYVRQYPSYRPIEVLWTIELCTRALYAVSRHFGRYGLSQARFTLLMFLFHYPDRPWTPASLAEVIRVRRRRSEETDSTLTAGPRPLPCNHERAAGDCHGLRASRRRAVGGIHAEETDTGSARWGPRLLGSSRRCGRTNSRLGIRETVRELTSPRLCSSGHDRGPEQGRISRLAGTIASRVRSPAR